MKKIKVEVDRWEKECPECGTVIYGVNIHQLEWNFAMHYRSCKIKARKKKNKLNKEEQTE